MSRAVAVALAFAVAAGAAFAMQFGHSCQSAKDCARAQECVPHSDITHEIVRYTCEHPCSVDEASHAKESTCPKGRTCVLFSDGPRSSLGGICVRMSGAPSKPR